MQWENHRGAADAKADGPVSIRAGDHLVTVKLMPAPMPFDQQLWQRTSRIWPNALKAVGQHRAHLIVSTIGAAEETAEIASLSMIESARLTTAVVGGVLEALPGCLGVVWDGKVALPAEVWLGESRHAFERYPGHPVVLWVEIVPFRCGETVGAYTLGMSAFTGREIEFEVDGLDQRTVTVRVAQLSSYLIANGLDAGIRDGGVFEADDEIDHPVAVLYRNSRFNIGPVVSFYSLHGRPGRLKTYDILPASIARHHPLLVMLSKVGLFDPTSTENQVQLRPDHHVSEVRLDSFDDSLSGALTGLLATDAYAEADTKARRALGSGDTASARSLLRPWAEEVGRLQQAVKLALTLRDAFMFTPAPPVSP